MEYLWMDGMQSPAFPSLTGEHQTDVLVIGGGMAGVLCALQLQRRGVEYMLVEAERIGGGCTKGTTAVLTVQHDTLYQQLIQRFDREKAGLYLEANLQALEHYRDLARDIPCDFEELPSVMYSRTDRARMEQEARAVRSLGFPAEFTTDTPMPFPVAGAVRYPGMAQFHPIKFLYGASKGLHIFENTLVTKLKNGIAWTENGCIHFKKAIVATHYPFVNTHGLFVMKLYQQRSYVIALKNAPDLGCTIEEAADNGIYLRSYRDLLLVGGGSHRTGLKGGGFSAPGAFAARYYPQAQQVGCWANQDCVSLDGAPYIGPYGAGLPDVFVASGFNLWGMTTSMAASLLLTDLVLGRKNPFASVFAPNRSMPAAPLLSHLGTTALDFLSPTGKRCSHLGCALKWNPAEHSWDCPCHGSRFDEKGRVLNNPAISDSHVE